MAHAGTVRTGDRDQDRVCAGFFLWVFPESIAFKFRVICRPAEIARDGEVVEDMAALLFIVPTLAAFLTSSPSGTENALVLVPGTTVYALCS